MPPIIKHFAEFNPISIQQNLAHQDVKILACLLNLFAAKNKYKKN